MASDPETTAAPTENLTFELKRFAWLTPDRLGVSGTFAGLEPPADDATVLVIRAGERVFRLPVAADGRGEQLDESDVWQAAFEWLDAPVAFDAAELELAEGLVVELPGLDGKRRLSRKRLLEVRNPVGSAVVEPAEPGSLGSLVELVAAQEALRGVRVAMQQTEQELERAREDLQAERELRTGDSQHFREELAKLRASAEQALAAEQSGQTTLREQLEAAESAQTAAEAEAKTLRDRVAELERDGQETERLRTQLEQARGAVDRAREDAERLIGRLNNTRSK